MYKRILGLFLFFSFYITGLVFAGGGKEPVQLALWSPIQLFSASDSIKGFRLNLLYTNNRDVSGVTLGIGCAKTSADLKGISLGAANWTDGSAYGFNGGLLNYTGKQSVGFNIGLINAVQGDIKGVQLGIVNWNGGFFHGWQLGAINEVNGSFEGFQSGLFNYAGEMSGLQVGIFNTTHSGTMAGLQLGLINYAAKMNGLQVGLFNITTSLDGVQIGAANYNGNRKPMVFMTLVNWSF